MESIMKIIDAKLRLRKALAWLQRKNEFKEGDLIKWKAGLKNRPFLTYAQRAIVIRVLGAPITSPCEDPLSPLFGEELDVQIGVYEFKKGVVVYHVDSRRFEPTKS